MLPEVETNGEQLWAKKHATSVVSCQNCWTVGQVGASYLMSPNICVQWGEVQWEIV
jgi:hypothetical protein